MTGRMRRGIHDCYIPCVFLFHVLNGATALDTSNRKASSIRKATDDSCLPLERALDLLVEFLRFLKIHDVDMSIRGPYNQQVVTCVHCVDALWTVDREHRIARSEIPKLDLLIPRTCRQHFLPVCLEVADRSYGLVVRRDAHCLLGA